MGIAKRLYFSCSSSALKASSARHLRILVAEDTVTNQIVLRAMIEKLGHRADVVGNGLEALNAVTSLPYDVVIMDVMMPEMDGVEAARAIRSLPLPQSKIPILGLTANISHEDHASYRLAGMDQIMTKPINQQDLGAALILATGPREGLSDGSSGPL